VSGLVVVFSPDPAVRALGQAGLSDLAFVDGYVTRSLETAEARYGVVGWPDAVSLHVEGEGDRDVDGEGDRDVEGDHGSPRVVVAFGGDLLNAPVLRRELGLSPSASAAQIVAAAHAAWGSAGLLRLEGAFAFVLRDAKARRTVAASDHCCVQPLHAVSLGEDVLFASEAKAFVRHPRFAARLDREALAEVVVLGHTLSGRPLFEGVLGLPHGAHFEVDDGGLRVVRHWDAAGLPRGSLRGEAYVDRLADSVVELAGLAYDDDGVVLPLTGGLDSRLLAALAPADRDVTAVTFGTPDDDDVRLAVRIAMARGLPHRTSPLEPDYVARFGADTVWSLEGRLSPVANITGGLMPRLLPAPFFVSGAGAAAGRHFFRSDMLVPNWGWNHASDDEFERVWPVRQWRSGLPRERTAELFVGGRELYATGDERRLAVLRRTRGLPAVDRQDLMYVQERERMGQTGLALADRWVRARAPLLTRRWVEAMLDGAPEERIDDRARLRLVTRLDAAVAGVPWSLTHLSLPASIHVVSALRVVGRLARRPLHVPDGGADTGRTPSAAASGAAARLASFAGAARARAQHLAYSHVDDRDAWLRGPSRAFVEEVLLSPRVAGHGVLQPRAVRALVDEHMAGAAHANAIGMLLTVELWQRYFEDGERPASKDA